MTMEEMRQMRVRLQRLAWCRHAWFVANTTPRRLHTFGTARQEWERATDYVNGRIVGRFHAMGARTL
jgi:hypothetical protein